MGFLRRTFSIHACLFWCAAGLVTAEVVPYLEQSFFFDWNPPSQPYPIPVTAQCEVIHITWGRSTATGPNPTAPYYLQVYTSAFIVPFIISAGDELSYDWAVPFSPGTLYQICMFDKNGNTGGCQEVYTVVPSKSSTPSCANVTFPSSLNVEASVWNGPMSQFGWIEQCTDISIMPQNGKPPYTMTIAPTLHPPYNITGDGTKPLNWTVNLSWASSFFVSVVDSEGKLWSNGRLHSAAGISSACLGNASVSPQSTNVVGIALGAGFGGLGVGLLVGLLGLILFHRCTKKRNMMGSQIALEGSCPNSPQGYTTNSLAHTVVTSTSRAFNMQSSSQYYVEPFTMPAQSATPFERADPGSTSASTALLATESTAPPISPSRVQSHVYVVYHDSGQAPVTVYTQDGTQVVELPPGYPGDATEPLLGLHSQGHSSPDEGNSSSAGETSRQTDSSFASRSRKPGQVSKPSALRPNR